MGKAKLRPIYWGLTGGSKEVLQRENSCGHYTESFNPSKCISTAKLPGGQEHQKEEARRICNDSQYLKSRKVRRVFMGGEVEGWGGC